MKYQKVWKSVYNHLVKQGNSFSFLVDLFLRWLEARKSRAHDLYFVFSSHSPRTWLFSPEKREKKEWNLQKITSRREYPKGKLSHETKMENTSKNSNFKHLLLHPEVIA